MNLVIDCQNDPDIILDVLKHIEKTTDICWASGAKPTQHLIRRGYLFIRTYGFKSKITYGPLMGSELPMMTAEDFISRNTPYKRF